jgi:GNAT superfamily N-acetyltransferase
VSWTIHPITALHDLTEFDCGEKPFDTFLQRHALMNHASGVGKTFVATAPGSTIVVGYFTLSMGSVTFDTLPDTARARLPKYPIPSAHMGRLAVALAAQGQGLGAALLIEAFSRAVRAGEHVGAHVIDVFAKHEKAKSFYLKYGFTALRDNPLHLFLPMETARRAVDAAEGR